VGVISLQSLLSRRFPSANGLTWDLRDPLLAACIGFAPLFLLTIAGWGNAFLFLASVLSVSLWQDCIKSWREVRSNPASVAIVLALASGMIAVLLSELLRNEFSLRALDGPSRMLAAIPVFLVLRRRKADFLSVLQYTLPLSLLLAGLSSIFFPYRWGDRLATYFVDPITYGNYALVLGFMCLFSLNLLRKDSRATAILKIAGFAAGIALSLASQTRSGWVAGCVLFALWLVIHGAPLKPLQRLALASAGIASAIFFYLFVDFVSPRVDDALYSVAAWFNGENRDTSIGFRLSMWRIALVLFSNSPLYGYGDVGYIHLLQTHPDIIALASPVMRTTMYTGPHNDLLAAMLQSGVFGLVSVLSLFLAPGYIFLKRIAAPDPAVRAASLLGLCLVTGLFFCSFGEQVFYLKFTSSFYGMMIAALGAAALSAGVEQPARQA
jgi:O-antigen ligase